MRTYPCNFCSAKIPMPDFKTPESLTCPACGLETRVVAPAKNDRVAVNLQPCPTCGAQVSVKANACPQCGHAFRQPGAVNLSDPVHVIGLGICVLIILAVVFMIISRTIGF